jgi:hypothetical protein
MSLVVLGIIFGDERIVGYSFIGVGALLSVIDAIRNRKKQADVGLLYPFMKIVHS